MAKQRVVTLNGGGDGSAFTNIRASIPCHVLRVYQDGQRNVQFVYKRKEDNFTEEYTTDQGDIINILGHGRSGIIGRAPSYSAAGTPPTTAAAVGDSGGGDIILKIKALTTATPDVVVYESESEAEE